MSHNLILGVVARRRGITPDPGPGTDGPGTDGPGTGGGSVGGTIFRMDLSTQTDFSVLDVSSDLLELTNTSGVEERNTVGSDRLLGIETAETFYWEVEYLAGDASVNGYAGAAPSSFYPQGATNPAQDNAWGYRGSGQIWENGGLQVSGLSTFGNGDIVMLAFNPSTGEIWTGVNGTWNNDPDVDGPNYTIPLARREVQYHLVWQAREAGRSMTIHSRTAEQTYAVPSSCIAAADYSPVIDTFYRYGKVFTVQEGIVEPGTSNYGQARVHTVVEE